MTDARWISVHDAYPDEGTSIELLHFGGTSHEIRGRGVVDQWGICPCDDEGGHAKRSTVTHWRPVVSGPDAGKP